MKVLFSLDLHDGDGDVYEGCLLLHIGDDLILKLKRDGLQDFIDNLEKIKKEIQEGDI